jgi:hypothetical protein
MPRFIHPAGLLALCAALTLLPKASASEAAPGGAAGASGVVVVLPLLDATGTRPEARDDYREAALAEIEARCRKAGIALVGREALSAALTELRLAPSDAEDRTKSRLAELAHRLQARYIVTGVIEEALCLGRYRGAFSDQKETGHARVRLRVFDVAAGGYVEEWELTGSGRARDEGYLAGRSQRLRCRAITETTRESLTRFLTACPPVLAREQRESAGRQATRPRE